MTMNELLPLLLAFPIVYLSVVSIPIVFFDVNQRRVPNAFTLPALYIWLICFTTYAVISGDWLWTLVMPILFGLVSLVVGVYFTGKGVVGMGDVKLITFMCLSLSWKFAWVWLVLPIASIVAGVAIGVSYVLLTGKDKNSIRLAPYIYLVYFVLIAILFLN